jgi:aminoglycoside phosphotransferase (APT) family kinase protein
MRGDKLRAGKFPVDAALVGRLVAAQFPHWADLPVRPVAMDGWDNWTFHLGETMKVRLPRAEAYAAQAEKEAHWLPRLAPHLPVAVPTPLGLGRPAAGFPWHWSIYRWIEGEPVSRADDGVRLAREVAAFLSALQAIDTTGGPPPGAHNFNRGAHPVSVYGEEARRSIDALGSAIDGAAAHRLLDAAAATRWNGAPVWVHGDIAAGNLLLRNGRLAAVIDFGCLAVGDPACDLVIAWLVFAGDSRAAFRAAVSADAGTWVRARAWALWKAALALAPDGSVAPPPLAVIEAVLAEQAGR